jgi:hypothetical protein
MTKFSKNSCKTTSSSVARVASKILRSPNYSKAVKAVAGSALSQKPSGRKR